MKFVYLVVAFVHVVTCGNVGVRTSHHLSPADVTYVHGSYHAGLAAGPIGYSASIASAPLVSAGSVATVTAAPVAAVSAGPALAAAPLSAIATGPAVAAAPVAAVTTGPALAAAPVAAVATGPALAAAPVAAVATGPALAAAPVAARISTVTAAPLAYAAPAPRFAAIPTVQHVPGVADVPVTRIDAQPAVIQKTIDVARPAIKTQRYEVRRPAIQKQFYDIEERVVVRPAGSAVLELDEPLSKIQKGPSVIQPSGGPVAVSTQAVAAPSGPAVSTAIPAGPVEVSVSGVSGTLSLPSVEANLARSSLPSAIPISSSVGAPSLLTGPPATIATSVLASPAPAIASVPAVPVKTVSTPIQASLVTGISSAPSGISVSSPVSISQPVIHSTPAPLYTNDDSVSIESAELSLARSSLARAQGSQLGLAKTVFQPIGRAYPTPASIVATIPNTGSVFQSAVPAARLAGHNPAAIYAARNLQSEINHENQQKLLHLLTARGGVTEIGFGRSGPAAYPVHAGDVRARVLSATPAPAYAAPPEKGSIPEE